MYVRKFEADTLDEALKSIKQELGPDAIILKTTTNKGLKGAFKKNKIEITAAISEKSYEKKAKVDMVLDDGQKQQFYSDQASYVSNMIDQHSSNDTNTRTEVTNTGYGKAGLNRSVKTKTELPQEIKSGLDDFLKVQKKQEEASYEQSFADIDFAEVIEQAEQTSKSLKSAPRSEVGEEVEVKEQRVSLSDEQLQDQRNKIDELEKKLYELTKSVEKFEKPEAIGLYQLRTTLRSLDINEKYIQKLLRKAMFEFSEKDLDNADLVFEYALREMIQEVNTDMPLFSSVENNAPVVTVLLSDSTSGQSSMVQKIGALTDNSLIIRNIKEDEKRKSFSEKVFKLDVVEVTNLAEIVSETRKATEQGRSVIIDYKLYNQEENEVKTFIAGLQRAFSNVEVLVTLSAIHSEVYNRKVLSTYGALASGLVVTQLDLCLNFGSLFNLTEDAVNLPYKFFGTGPIIPDDIETATSERIIAGLFQL